MVSSFPNRADSVLRFWLIRVGRGLIIILTALLVMPGVSRADTIRFTNDEVNLGLSSQIDLSTQYSTLGLLFQDVYRYIDSRDPFPDSQGGFGIANGSRVQNFDPSALGRVQFTSPVSFITFDWWTIGDNVLMLKAFDANGIALGSFAGTGFGSNTIAGARPISYFTFGDSGGFVQISNLTFSSADPVPEPATLLLIATGFLGVASRARRGSRR